MSKKCDFLKKTLFARMCFIVFAFFFLGVSVNVAYADSGQSGIISRQRCDINDECRPGFVCVGGWAKQTAKREILAQVTDEPTGCCEPMLVIRQVCFFHNLLHGMVGNAIITLVLISVGFGFLCNKFDTKKLITVVVGIICFYGPYQVVALLTGYDYIMCDLVDTDYAPGDGCNVYSSYSA